MPTSVTIRRPEGPLHGRITLPPAKSVANRALVLATLAGDPATVADTGGADDVRILRQLLTERPHRMPCGDGGTTFRFLLAWACVQPGGEHLLTGSRRLLQRPHLPLVEALRSLGADITPAEDGFLVRGRAMPGGRITLHAPVSSQFISALLLVAPCFTEGIQLQWTGQRLSEPYVHMTAALLKHYGAHVAEDAEGIQVAPGALDNKPFTVPADWSAAAFWYQIAALAPDAVLTLQGLQADGLQGDEAAALLFRELVASRTVPDGLEIRASGSAAKDAFTADLVRTPDLFQPLAFTMAAQGRPGVFTGLHNLPLKETDRLKAVADALCALGCATSYNGGTFTLTGRIGNLRPPPFNPQGDHRMAMALAPLALVCDSISILDPGVVHKSYPGFWEDLRGSGFCVREEEGPGWRA